MPKNKEGRPEWFKFWRRNRQQLDIELLSMHSRGIIFTNMMRYFDSGDSELLEMSPVEVMGFNIVKMNVDDSFSEYETIAERNRENGKKGGRPTAAEITQKTQSVFYNPDEPKKPEVRSQNTEERSQKSEYRSQRVEEGDSKGEPPSRPPPQIAADCGGLPQSTVNHGESRKSTVNHGESREQRKTELGLEW